MALQDWNDRDEVKRWDAQGYTRNPMREEQLDLLLSIIADHYQPGKWVLDLGYGSGQVEKMLFERIPDARVVGIDASQEMMALAAERLADYQDQYVSIEHDLANIGALTLPAHPYQFVIAIQSLHHLTPGEMQAAYQFIYNTLKPGGLFLLLDRMKVDTSKLWSVFQSVWSRQDRIYSTTALNHEGKDFADHEQIVRERGDLPVNQASHLTWMRDAGFEAACLHLHGNRALIAGRKS